jgi:hypothetical protein
VESTLQISPVHHQINNCSLLSSSSDSCLRDTKGQKRQQVKIELSDSSLFYFTQTNQSGC